MQTFLEIIGFMTQNFQAILSALIAILMGVIAIALIIPGEQPEKALQGFVDFLTKFSKK